jgi:hypothetical protein
VLFSLKQAIIRYTNFKIRRFIHIPDQPDRR